MPNTAYAMIDLSSLSSADSGSHNCVYQQLCDESNHWKECILCRSEINRNSHDIKTEYSISPTSCSTSNKKITSCKDCDYYSSSNVDIKHTCNNISYNIKFDTGEVYLYSGCLVCGNTYNYSYNGYTYTYEDGTEVDYNNPQIKVNIVNPDGDSRYVGYIYKEVLNYQDHAKVDYSFSDDYKTLNARITYEVPQKAYEYFDESQFTDNKFVRLKCFAINLMKGYESKLVEVVPSSVDYDSLNKTLTYEVSIELRDYTKDYLDGYILPTLYLYNDAYYYSYTLGKIAINTNFIEPIIDSTKL